jgi:hypothetical protein
MEPLPRLAYKGEWFGKRKYEENKATRPMPIVLVAAWMAREQRREGLATRGGSTGGLGGSSPPNDLIYH